ncbi:NAD(P)/FAD-dependent oxidoreductase [Embleya sp. NBC_00896]|uniref:flavin-containing monooxygenase n=1 Tax=Embleya sp. NBC_00896 TaxID=2975961 RepID=UPI002F90BF44|nr:NAD(P)/FAD-dependent oxidoreductase [Embleya sp. NBC_00896]
MMAPRPTWPHRRTPQGPTIGVLGASAGGLAMGVRLKRAGFHDFVIFEKSAGVGGTWRDNTYPGAACDIMSHLYSFSFAPNPAWSRTYADQPEILAYLESIADRFGLRPHLRLATAVTEARWDDDANHWRLHTESGESHHVDILISALGMLNLPAVPNLVGLDGFAGNVFHSARWDHDHDLAGKRVAVVGTGASAVQFVPEIVERTERVHVFQRSPAWIVPKLLRPYTPEEIRRFRTVPGAGRRHRWQILAQLERNTSIHTADARTAERENWHHGHLRRQIPDDPDLRAALTPDYPIGCKRLLPSDTWFPALARPDVELVTTGIERVTRSGVRTVDGREREVDTIILGTGFRAGEYLAAVDVFGRDGRRLRDDWRDGAQAYLGMAVAGYPNLFVMYGPNTNQGGGSILFVLEAQARYITAAVRAMARRRLAHVEVRREIQDAFNARIQQAMDGTVWQGCDSYFRAPNGRITTQWPYPARRYWWETRRLRLGDYRTTRTPHPGASA